MVKIVSFERLILRAVRVLDYSGRGGDQAPLCLGGRGAAPPEFCGGPTGYRLMLKRQQEGGAMSDPIRLEAGIQLLAEACPDQSARTWELLHTVLGEGFQSIDRRLHELGPLQPDRFSLKETNARLSELAPRWRVRQYSATLRAKAGFAAHSIYTVLKVRGNS